MIRSVTMSTVHRNFIFGDLICQYYLFPSSVRGDEPVELVEVHLLAGDQRHVAVRRPARRNMTLDTRQDFQAQRT